MKNIYRVRLENTKTGEKQLTWEQYTSAKKAKAFAEKWTSLGEPYKATAFKQIGTNQNNWIEL